MRAVSTAASSIRHTFGVALEALVLLAIVAVLVVGSAVISRSDPAGAGEVFAAKGGNGADKGGGGTGGGSAGGAADSIVVGSPDGAGLRVAPFVYGDVVTTYSTLARDYDFVYARVQCFANDTSVATTRVGQQMYDVFQAVKEQTWTSFESSFDTTASAGWTGGGADCTATLLNAVWKGGNRTYNPIASAAFSVTP